MHLHIEDRQENSSACQHWAATILSQPALPQFNSWVRKKASSWLSILTGQMATVSWLLAGHMNGSGAVYNLQALFHVGLAETTSVLVFRTFWLLQCYWIPKSEQKINKYKFEKKLSQPVSHIFLHLFSCTCFCLVGWFLFGFGVGFVVVVAFGVIFMEKTSHLKYIQYILLQKSVHLQHWNLQLLVI